MCEHGCLKEVFVPMLLNYSFKLNFFAFKVVIALSFLS